MQTSKKSYYTSEVCETDQDKMTIYMNDNELTDSNIDV